MSIADTRAAALPTHRDLPCTDGKPVENSYQPHQSALLTDVLVPLFDQSHPDGDYFVGMDNGIYWEITDPPLDGCRAPDWFYVPGVPKFLDGELRRSYVMWQEQVAPLVVIEYVSGNGAEERDRTPRRGKWWVYEQAVKADYYVIRDPARDELEVNALVNGRYRPVPTTAGGRYPIAPLGIELGIWEGEFQSLYAGWLRAWDRTGVLLPTGAEAAVAARTRADALAARLRALGVDPDAP